MSIFCLVSSSLRVFGVTLTPTTLSPVAPTSMSSLTVPSRTSRFGWSTSFRRSEPTKAPWWNDLPWWVGVPFQASRRASGALWSRLSLAGYGILTWPIS